VAEFRKAVSEGTAYLLSDDPLYPKKPFAYVGLLVERFTEAKDLEAWVCMTVAVFDTEPTYKGQTDTWLLLHENPVSDHYMSGKGFSELNYMIEFSEQTEGSAEAGETALHVAARSGNEVNFAKLVLGGAMDLNVRDKRGWTPLHSAASAGQARLIGLLVDAGADVNTFDNEGRSALVLATENGHLDSIMALFEVNADVNLSDPRGWSPLNTATMSTQIEALRLLIALGANPSNPDAGGWTALEFSVVWIG
jgi:ankyrin repeat protein